ncbi:F-actin-monooxygenase Mical-like isoform X4 [Photinus pyralis]|uniref:F-actin-monooxygenase Mical-like isoform X4 n=1 Tax=Photinus pyralis TaxID=7054 RepID=UPI001266F9F5|nr:F-actin-monooxygenase Mical-like isoform X4 [Photinus pyralis]
MERFNKSLTKGRPISTVDAAKANDAFDHFINAGTLKSVFGCYRNICELLHLKPNVFPQFYPKLKDNLTSWKAKALWKKFDARASHKCYARGKICPNTRVLIIGAGPCGLRTAIEAQLLGAKVVVVEKRDRMSRNNVLHLWPFVIEDLRALGAKKFFGKFCAGAIDHISIRQLQCILLKVALLLGVEVHTEVSFEKLVEPNSSEKIGWRAEFKPVEHPVSQYEFDVIVGADGKRNTLQGFKRKEFRGKLAIAITANFINKRTEAEARVEEISGVAFIFNQKFFKELNAETGIDLENIVYYKDDTHYFVMTAKKLSLIEKGVILQDYPDTARLLSPENVDRDNLMEYAREAAEFSTNYQMPDLEFAVNHYGQPDVAMFDFTSMYAAENASKVIERHGYKLFMILVGDSLLEPFWPTGSGCARGFLSSLDACWAIKGWGSGLSTPLEVLAERESIYRLLAQTTPENLNKDCKAYTVDPSTRYPNLNKSALLPQQVLTLYDTDDPNTIELTSRAAQPFINELHRKRRKRDLHLDANTLIGWIKEQIKDYDDLLVEDLTNSFRDGRVLCAILHHYRPDLLDYGAIKSEDVAKNNQLAFDLLEKEIGISPIMTGEEMAKLETPDYLTMFSYLTQIYDTFRGEIPHIKHPKLDLSEVKENIREKTIPTITARINDGFASRFNIGRSKRHAEMSSSKPATTERKNKKRRSFEKYDMSVEERRKRLEEIAANRLDRQNKRRQQRKMQTEQFIKSMQMLQMNAKPDQSQPFEDYSLFVYRQTAPDFQDRVKNLEKQFTYIPDRENRLPTQSKTGAGDEEFAARIKDIEEKWRYLQPTEKKPKDLTRAIGKIETSDWNIKEIEKKILENKLGKSVNREKERVPKWNREQFLARQKKCINRQNSGEAKFSELDKGIKHLEQRLKEGSLRDLGTNKVAKITEKLLPKDDNQEAKPIKKNIPKPPVVLPTNSGSEYCHFCQKRVYLMERLSAEGRFFHRGCFKCQYCYTTLRLGSYLFDKEGQYGYRFYCLQHFGMVDETEVDRVDVKQLGKIRKEQVKPLEKLKIPLTGVEGVDLLNRVQTPERIEFSNLSAGHISSDHDESLSQMDEDEWTDRNFGASTAEICSSDEYEDSSSASGSESDNEEVFEEALEEPPTKEGTLRWMERYKQRYSKERRDSDSEDYISSSDHSSYDENTSGDEEDEPATEGEEEIRARELRKQEVRVEPPVIQTDTGSDTEIVSDDTSPESSSKHNSATEISTDSEFAVDDPTPTREIPAIVFNDQHVTMRKASFGLPKKVQVKSGILNSPNNGKIQSTGIRLEFTPLVPSPIIPKAAPSLLGRTEGYALNRTQSTGGIATKVSLELKKKYLLGDSEVPGSIQKSGSVSTLDSKFKSFHTNITDCQKLLKPSSENVQATPALKSPLSPIISQSISNNESPQIPAHNFDKTSEKQDQDKFQNEMENRPRSPAEEIPVIVPQIDWKRTNSEKVSDMSSDSLTSSDSDLNQHSGIKKSPTVKIIPRVEIHDDDGKIIANETVTKPEGVIPEPTQDLKDTKVVISEKKILNPPKALPNLENVLSDFHTELHESKIAMGNESSRSTPSDHESFIEQTAAAMTETELSDWARDSTVSDDFEDVEYELNPDLINVRKNKPPKGIRSLKNSVIKAYIDEFDDLGHVCQKSENLNNILSSIEFMDTGEETSSDEKLLLDACTKNNGYVEFHNEDDIAEDSLNPMFNIVETVNPAIRQALDLENLSSYDNNTGYCFIGNEDNFGSEVISLKPSDLQKLKEKQSAFENEEDSLLVVDTGTTTEENTCSDSTVKNFVEVCAKKETPHMIEALLEEKRVEDENQNNDVEKHQDLVNAEYQEHCQRLQGKFEFGNMRDSIEIRKSKRKEKPVSSKPDLIQEEVSQVNNVELIPPKTLQEIYTKEEIKKSRDENQRLVQEMVMNKMKAQNKSLERKKRSRNSFSPGSSPNKFFELTKSPTADVFLNMEHQQVENERLPPDVLLSSNGSVINCHSEQQQIIEEPQKISPIVTLPDLQQKIVNGEKSELRKSKTRLKSSDELISKIGKENRSIDVQDSIEALVINTERRNSLLYATDTLTKKRKNSFKRSKSGEEPLTHNILNTSEPTRLALSLCSPENPMRSTKSVSEILKTFETADLRRDLSCVDKKAQFYKSDPNLLANAGKEKKTKCKDRDRRKSITKLISEFFGKKREGAKGTNSSASKGFLAKISPKSKSKSMILLNGISADKIPAVNLPRRNSFGEAQIRQREAVSPPPIPPLPTNYTGSAPSRYTDESSEGDNDYKHHDQNSCDTLNHSGTHGGRRTSRSMRRASRQSQLKRHRMAQEIQRKLEETEVKTRELEQKGVCVEKALRGEDSGIGAFNTLDEADLLKQWFDLMRDLTELRRYERELMVRAQEVELEDRHARLQQELRERLDNDEHKSKEDIKIESGIINEMMEIVSKRDSLIALLEQDRLRYSEEDRDFEEQMLAKGLRLTPLQKQPVTEVIDKIC